MIEDEIISKIEEKIRDVYNDLYNEKRNKILKLLLDLYKQSNPNFTKDIESKIFTEKELAEWEDIRFVITPLGVSKKEEKSRIKKDKKRSSLSVIMNNGDIIIGTYNTSSFNVAISVNDEIIYDIHIKDCDDNKLVDKMKDEYIKYLTNKKYKIKKYLQENAKY